MGTWNPSSLFSRTQKREDNEDHQEEAEEEVFLAVQKVQEISQNALKHFLNNKLVAKNTA